VKNKLNIPSLKLVAEQSNCRKCGACNKNCPMSIDVMEKVQHNNMESSDCILCGECSKACKFDAINRICGKNRVKGKVLEIK
jgi:ferredoxin